ncbi:MAG: pyruvate formate lyase family protein [Eubacteriales bacterium]
MTFDTAYQEPRPVRLSERTRQFAYDSLHFTYGKDTARTCAVSLDHIPEFEQLSALDKYNAAIFEIVTKAPLRLCEGELLSGAATLGAAIDHMVPATYGGKLLWRSVSHLTLGFERVLTKGMNHIKQELQEALLRHTAPEKIQLVASMIHCIDCLAVWHGRYLEALRQSGEHSEALAHLQQVPFGPATNFFEAVQSLWFIFAFTRLCGNWPGIGRMDDMLGRYLTEDLQKGRVSLAQAREYMAHFFIKGCEWIRGTSYGTGDAQHYQNIVLSGVDEQGVDLTNEVTYLVLDIVEELGISDFPLTVRVNRHTDPALLRRMAEVIRHGGGIVAVYNEDLILEALTAAGHELTEARTFANAGCWEVQIPGKTYFTYAPFDALQVLQHTTLAAYDTRRVHAESYEALYRQYQADLQEAVEAVYQRKNYGSAFWNERAALPCSVVSLFTEGCAEAGLSYYEGGAIYTIASPHIGGVPDVANSLYAIKKLVFEEQKLSLAALLEILQHNWEGHEPLRQYVRHRYTYFGNDNDEVDEIAARILHDFAGMCHALQGRSFLSFPPGVSTFGRQIEWAPLRLASPHGHHKGAVLAGNLSPTPGTDCKGATAAIRSYCKADLRELTCGAALDIHLLPTLVANEEGMEALVGLLQGFVTLGGFFMQIDVVDRAVLRAAQQHPEQFPTLAVRVSGWNARFVTLHKEWQDMIIARAERGALL